MFVERDENGQVKGLYACLQPGYAEEELADDHPDVVAYRQALEDAKNAPPPKTELEKRLEALETLLEQKAVLVKGEVDAQVASIDLTPMEEVKP